MRLTRGNFWGSPPPVGNFASMCTSAVDLSMANWLNAGRNSTSKTSSASLPAPVSRPHDSEQEQKLVWATQGAPKPDLFEAKVGGTAWKSKPSWYIVAKQDRTIQPDLERFFAKRMGATTSELDSSHVPMLSQPDSVLDVIRKAADA